MRRTLRGGVAVDLRTALGVVGVVLEWFALAFAAPAVVALAAGEAWWPFVASGLATLALGFALARLGAGRPPLGVREGFLVVAAVWLLVPALGALPFAVGGGAQLDRPLDAYFEAMSGFTATGATVLTRVDAVGRGMLFWRQLTHWLGGMGIIVLAVAVLPRLRIGGRELLRSELPGPTDAESFGATVRDTARRLWKVYVAVSAVGVLALAALGWTGLDPRIDLFEAFSFATSAVALGGFAPDPESARALAPVTQWLLCALMVVAGVNFLRLYRLLALRQVRAAVRDEELRFYLAIAAAASAVLTAVLLAGGGMSAAAAVRHAAFQAVSVMTTTGFATLDWTRLAPAATLTLLGLMFVGACAGSPSGSIKVVRHLTLFRFARRELEQAVHPQAVVPVRISGRALDDRALRATVAFVALYALTFVAGMLGVALAGLAAGTDAGALTAIGAVAACLGNVGPGLGRAGPFGSYASFDDVSTAILTALMFLGRIEIVPLAVLVGGAYWRA